MQKIIHRKISEKIIKLKLKIHVLIDNLQKKIYNIQIWVWRRLVARYLGVVEVVGSNPVTQTSILCEETAILGAVQRLR